MQVSLTPEVEELVRGLYGDAREVICEAPRLLAARDELDRLKLEWLRAALIASERSGLVEDFSMDELMAELDEEARAEIAVDG